MEINRLIVSSENSGKRIDVFLAEVVSDVSRSLIQKMAADGKITINDVVANKKTTVKENDVVEFSEMEPKIMSAVPQDIPIDIMYEDEDIIVVDKPKGLVVHPAPGNLDNTLVNALLFHCGDRLSSIGGVIRPGIVHRIDKNTSGLLLVAKNDMAHIELSKQIKSHSFLRIYHTVVYGNVKEDHGIIDKPIGRSKKDRKKMAIVSDGRDAITEFNVLKRFDGYTYMTCKLHTGRTHQIRVHLASRGNPVAGDEVYGPKKIIKKLSGQCLHAKILGFEHPRTKKYMEFESPLPKYFADFLSELKPVEVFDDQN